MRTLKLMCLFYFFGIINNVYSNNLESLLDFNNNLFNLERKISTDSLFTKYKIKTVNKQIPDFSNIHYSETEFYSFAVMGTEKLVVKSVSPFIIDTIERDSKISNNINKESVIENALYFTYSFKQGDSIYFLEVKYLLYKNIFYFYGLNKKEIEEVEYLVERDFPIEISLKNFLNGIKHKKKCDLDLNPLFETIKVVFTGTSFFPQIRPNFKTYNLDPFNLLSGQNEGFISNSYVHFVKSFFKEGECSKIYLLLTRSRQMKTVEFSIIDNRLVLTSISDRLDNNVVKNNRLRIE